MFDKRRPYGNVFGANTGGAVFHQDGHYYDNAGNYRFSNPGLPPPEGVKKARTLEEVLAGDSESPAVTEKKEGAAQIASAVTANSNQSSTTTLPDGATREQKLAQMTYFQLANLVKAAGGEPEKGSGAKQKMIAYLLANTSE